MRICLGSIGTTVINVSNKVYFISSCDFNQRKETTFLEEFFIPLYDDIQYATFRRAKGYDYSLLSQAYFKLLKLNPMTKPPEAKHVFFSNLIEDFDPKLLRVFPNIKYSGIIHDTYFDEKSNGSDPKNQAYEEFVLETMHKGFVCAQYIYDILIKRFPQYEHKLVKAFIPKIKYNRNMDIRRPKKGEPFHILWNHRVSKGKNYKLFLKVVDLLKKDNVQFHICTNSWTPQCLKVVNDYRDAHPDLLKIHLKMSQEEYHDMIRKCYIGFTTSEHDTFPGSVLECMNSNMPYLVPDRKDCSFIDFTIPEFQWESDDDDENEAYNIINLLWKIMDEPEYYKECVIKQKELLKEFDYKKFAHLVFDELEIKYEKITQTKINDAWDDVF